MRKNEFPELTNASKVDLFCQDASYPSNKHKKVVREAFKDGGSVVTFDDMKVTTKELTDALVALDISFMMGDMPYSTKGGGITYKKTLIVSNQEKVQKIINEKD